MGHLVARRGDTALIPPDGLTPAVPAPWSMPAVMRAWLDEQTRLSRISYQTAILSATRHLLLVGVGFDGPPTAVAEGLARWSRRRALAPATVNKELAAISSYYKYLLRLGYVNRNPVEMVKRPKVDRYGTARSLPLAQVSAALAAIDLATVPGRRDYAILSVFLTTGRRLHEIAALRMGDVVLDGAQVILRTIVKGGGSRRDALARPVALTVLAVMRDQYGDGPFVATDPLWRRYGVACEGGALADVGVRRMVERRLGTTRVHALRHTFARAYQEVGRDVDATRRALGHRSLATTSLYLERLREDESPFADAVAARLGINGLSAADPPASAVS